MSELINTTKDNIFQLHQRKTFIKKGDIQKILTKTPKTFSKPSSLPNTADEKAEAKPKAEPEAESELEPKAEAKSKTKAKAEAKAKPKAETETKSFPRLVAQATGKELAKLLFAKYFCKSVGVDGAMVGANTTNTEKKDIIQKEGLKKSEGVAKPSK